MSWYLKMKRGGKSIPGSEDSLCKGPVQSGAHLTEKLRGPCVWAQRMRGKYLELKLGSKQGGLCRTFKEEFCSHSQNNGEFLQGIRQGSHLTRVLGQRP